MQTSLIIHSNISTEASKLYSLTDLSKMTVNGNVLSRWRPGDVWIEILSSLTRDRIFVWLVLIQVCTLYKARQKCWSQTLQSIYGRHWEGKSWTWYELRTCNIRCKKCIKGPSARKYLIFRWRKWRVCAKLRLYYSNSIHPALGGRQCCY